MTEVPTLGEMRQVLADPAPPTLGEMAHANLLYQTDPEAYLEHYGIKGMKWGIRRPSEVLDRMRGRKASTETKDEEGNVVGGIRAKTRAGAQKLKDMRDGSTLILEDASGATKIMSKQKDGTFKEVYLSADAERVLRTTKKAESEMSDKEINDAINRSKKIEEYNKLFNPQPNPNADLEARVKAMQLEIQLKQAQMSLNPPKEKLVKKFVNTVSGGYGAYTRADKATNGLLNDTLKQLYDDLKTSKTGSTNSPAGEAFAAANAARKASQTRKQQAADKAKYGNAGTTRADDMNISAEQQKRVDDYVYNITTMGRNDPTNPFYNPNPPGPSIPPYYPELERGN